MKTLFGFFIAFAVYQTSFAQQACHQLFQVGNPVVEQLQGKSIPIGLVDVYQKKIPVILANHETVQEMQSVLTRSLGIVVAHQKGYNNDHGLFRLGEFFIDRDQPGHRNRGEINDTGITWAAIDGYTQYTYRNGKSYNRIEVLFHLSEAEYSTALIYQKMRRAALVRPDFSFGGDTNPKNVNNRLKDCGEICFSFSTGSAANQQIYSITNKIKEFGFQNVNDLLQLTEIKNFVGQSRDLLLHSSLDQRKLTPRMLAKLDTPEVIKNLNLNGEATIELLNWIVGLEITRDYAKLMADLGINNSSDYSNAASARASAVVVYDGNVTNTQFLNANYTSEGIFSTWRNAGLVPVQK